MSSRQTSKNETLHYRLRPNSQGIRLDIWEDQPTCSPDQASYRFFVTYQLKSSEEAQVILGRYLITNDLYTATPSNNDITPIHLKTLVGSTSAIG